MDDAYLALEDGTVFKGRGRSSGEVLTEVVFNTAYTGYEESITDPSYNGQALLFAYPLIGNYGVDERRFESDGVQPDAVVSKEFTDEVANWLQDAGVPAIDRIDTRSIIHRIRNRGSMACAIAGSSQRASELAESGSLSEKVITFTPTKGRREYTSERAGDVRIVLLDCGVKESMISYLAERGATVVRLPWTASVESVFDENPDILFVSNGPGNPEDYENAIDIVRAVDVPIAGICLGQQIIALAYGGSTRKMKFGHRGVNQPVYDTDVGNVRMTTQNHSFEVANVPDELDVVQYNINDDSPEGLTGDGILCRQYHPEANPGPHDSFDFFDEVISLADRKI